ncbi:glycosyltransferase family 2 protein [Methylobacterium sp. WL30]|uniref:glycosyltransferase family 2 protein n=1 Tax=unclassified Methylobacterium TaxID=2615210 RepID=UPI0011C7EC1B|nr:MULTISPECIES: glycosyltransferase family 2 protein [unclassified Methylobacterium]TXN42026.1 glycosyltransferase family 2 protein [Methylobacterium sp. WL93]TXN52684.1 glycosyltransferase family 2 protein [Methylobacterium sp. WL119]TXN69952.1 glycosyltransferase family 2 protein [Methylobacterium sp. WL30]
MQRDADGLRLDLAGLGLDGAWVTITLYDDPAAPREARPLMSLVVTDDARPGVPLADEAIGGGVSTWTGQVPAAIRALRIANLADGRPPHPSRITVRRRTRPALVARAFARAPGLAVQAVYWRSLGKRVRGRGFLDRALRHRTESGYAAWIRRADTLDPAERRRIRAEVSAWETPPLISILMPVYDPAPKVLRTALLSVQAQLYPHWELCVVDDASTDPAVPRLLERFAASDPRIRVACRSENGHIARATNDALAAAQGPFCAFLDHDDALPAHALYEVVRAIRIDPDLVLIYSDEDKIDRRGSRFDPHFKADFDRELLYGQNYINHLTVIRTEALRAVGGLRPGFEGSQDHDLLLRLTDGLDPARIRHIPAVLYHWRAAGGSGTFSDRALARAEAARLQALAEVVAPWGGRAERGSAGFNRLVRPLPDPVPRVSVIIPTRDRAELLRVTLDGLFGRTAYPAIEVIVVDNDSREPETHALFTRYRDDPRLRVLPVPGAFNFSDLSNRGAAAATGSVLLFLNNDVEVIEPGWLRELVSIALAPDIGAVGAKLLYPDGTLQHGGVILGIGGVAGHSHLGLDGTEPGYFGRMTMAHEVSAVTGACLAMRADVFAALGGFDAEDLKVAFNDVDLCLRVRAAGYRIVWTPFAALVHHESKSRGPEDTPEKWTRFERETAVMQARWGARLRADPYYNINLSRISGHYRL